MYHVLKQTSYLKRALTANAIDLGVDANTRGWCAGNESRTLAEMWHSMANGTAIDEQRALRWSNPAGARSSAAESSKAAQPQRGSDDSDVDPNDIEPTGKAGASATGPRTILDDWDMTDEEDEAGEAHYRC